MLVDPTSPPLSLPCCCARPRRRLNVAESRGLGEAQGPRCAAIVAALLALLATGPAWAGGVKVTTSVTTPPPKKDAPPPDDQDDDDEDEDFTLGAEADLDARYLWRGLALSDGPVAQPSVWATVYGLNAVLWTNVMLTDQVPRRLSAIVPALSYTFEWKSLTIEPGVLFYDMPGQSVPPSTAEASLEASWAFGSFHLLTTDFVDVAHAPGAYYGTFGASWEPKRRRWSFKLLADVGFASAPFNQIYFDARVAAIDVGEVGGKVQYQLNDVLYVAVHAEGSRLLSSALSDDGKPTTLGNVGLTFGGEVGL